MNALELIEYVESIGHGLILEGEKLRIRQGKCLPLGIKELIIQHKLAIVEILERDQSAKDYNFLIGISGTLYFRSVSKNSVMYIEMIDNQWVAWRETYQRGKEKAVNYIEIFRDENFNYVLLKVKEYFDYIGLN